MIKVVPLIITFEQGKLVIYNLLHFKSNLSNPAYSKRLIKKQNFHLSVNEYIINKVYDQ